MDKPTYGATLGDVAIALEQFAEHHPWRFVLTMPLTLGFGLLIAGLALKIIVLGPLTNHKDKYDTTRSKAKARNPDRELL
jgi:hypothetical protein